MWSITLPRATRISGHKKIRSSAKKKGLVQLYRIKKRTSRERPLLADFVVKVGTRTARDG
jgi:hypothetical protein